MNVDYKVDLLVLGMGAAAELAAIYAHDANPDLNILIATKALKGKGGCSRMVQGGFNVVLDPGDSHEKHLMDTLKGGQYINDQDLALNESMSLEELRANMEKSKKELEHAIHNKNILEQRKRIVERKERSHKLIVKGAEFEKAFPLSRDLEQEEVQDVMEQLQNSSYNKSIVRQVHIAALHKEQQQIAEAVERAEKGDDS